MMNKAKLAAVPVFLLLSISQCVASAEGKKAVVCKEQWEYLKGFHAVVVGVDARDPEFAESGANKDEIKERVEGMLKSEGIEVTKYDPANNGVKDIGYMIHPHYDRCDQGLEPGCLWLQHSREFRRVGFPSISAGPLGHDANLDHPDDYSVREG